MNKEEKEAIKYLEFLSNEKCECEACQRAKKEYKIILNLIKKQQKEIEELKETNEDNAEKSLLNDIYIKKNYISKDKIRERIQEARKIRWHIPKLVIEYFEELLEGN